MTGEKILSEYEITRKWYQILILMYGGSYIIVRLQNTGIYGIYNPKALAVAPERSKGATKGLRVINFVAPCVLKSNFFRP